MASAEVQIVSSGTSMPLDSSRARRSRGVKIELLVRIRKRRPEAFNASTNSVAPSIGTSSCTRTPSMSVSQVSTGRGVSSVGMGRFKQRPAEVRTPEVGRWRCGRRRRFRYPPRASSAGWRTSRPATAPRRTTSATARCSGRPTTGRRSRPGCRSTRRTTARRRPRPSRPPSRRRGSGACCWSARAASPWPGWRARRWSSTRSGSGTCRDGPRRAARASSGSPGVATTRRDRPTRPPPTTPRGSSRRGPLVTGGDHVAVDEVLADPRLRTFTVVEPWLPVPDPRRAVLDQAIRDAASVRVRVVNA